MVRRVKKTTKKKPAVKRKKPAKRPTKKTSATISRANNRAQWQAFKDLQNQIHTAWNRLQSDVKNKANPQAILRDKNELLLLLGECNYMARECMSVIFHNK